MKLPGLACAILLSRTAIVVAQENSTSNATTFLYIAPVLEGWAALGDSFAAGIGAGGDVGGSGSCSRRTGAYPIWLNSSPDLIYNNPHNFSFLACSGDTTANVIATQIPQFSASYTSHQDVVTLSIGGNDVGFARILDACITQAWWSDCDAQLAQAPTTITNLIPTLVNTYTNILSAVQEANGRPGFRLIVTGYPTFFNAETTACDGYSFGFWPWRKPPLTTQLRTSINNLVLSMNNAIQSAVNQVNNNWRATAYPRVFFVNPDDAFTGHRFCEDGVVEPDGDNPNTWFFLINGQDSPDPSPDLEPPADFTPQQCDAILAEESPSLGEDWGNQLICAIMNGTAAGNTTAPWLNLTGDNFVFLPEGYGKFFHPKTVGHQAIAGAVGQQLRNTYLPVNRVLIMWDGNANQWTTFINSLPEQTSANARAIAQDAINLKGYVTYLTQTEAVQIQQNNQVLGISFEQEPIPIPTVGLVGGSNDTVPQADDVFDVDDYDDPYPDLNGRQISTTPLSLQLFPSYQLDSLSIPPLLTGAAYYRYPGYVFDPAGGSGVMVYVLDSGVFTSHSTFQSTPRTPITNFAVQEIQDGPADVDAVGHGTCMASLAVGNVVGVARGTMLTNVKWMDSLTTIRASALFEALLYVLNDVITSNRQGQAVISFSHGNPIAKWFNPFAENTPEEWILTDPWNFFLPCLFSNDIVVVCSAGNNGNTDTPSNIDGESPRLYAAPGRAGQDKLIVVGASTAARVPWVRANTFYSIITTWAPGEDVYCASNTDANTYVSNQGSSESTALTAGMVATYISSRTDLQARLGPVGTNTFVANMRQVVWQNSRDAWLGDLPTVPTLTTYNFIPCPDPYDDGDDVAPSIGINGTDDGGNFTSGATIYTIRTASGTLINNYLRQCLDYRPAQRAGLYTYRGCYADTIPPSQILTGPSSTQVNLNGCADFCDNATATYPYFGMVAGSQCFCGDTVNNLEPVDIKECNSYCTRAPYISGQICGGLYNNTNRMSLYQYNPQGFVPVGGWNYSGCYAASAQQPALAGPSQSSPNMTLDACAEFCCGSDFFGVESGMTCLCGSSVVGTATNDTQCSIPCGGNVTETCGGESVVEVYQNLSPSSGCTNTTSSITSVASSTSSAMSVISSTLSLTTTSSASASPPPPTCPSTLPSCSAQACAGSYNLTTGAAACTASGALAGCACTPSLSTCPASQACGANNCAGTYDASTGNATCKGFFPSCPCEPSLSTCGSPESCDQDNCNGAFSLTTGQATCQNYFSGCPCIPSSTTCGSPQSCDQDNCAGAFNLTNGIAYCTNYFKGCVCETTTNTCGSPQSCDQDSCDGTFNLNNGIAYCTNFFSGCECTATAQTCGTPQSCTQDNCDGAFDLSNGIAYCTNYFNGCECEANAQTCGTPQSCDQDNCDGAFPGNVQYPQCTNYFAGCQCSATSNTCGSPQSCDNNGCAGGFSGNVVYPTCEGNFRGCVCEATSYTCGSPQSCDLNGCDGAFDGEVQYPTCQENFVGCQCSATSNTCGSPQSCDNNGCAGAFDGDVQYPTCQGNFVGCQCEATSNTCGSPQSCDNNGCAGAFPGETQYPICEGNFVGCQCIATATTCGTAQSCANGGCAGSVNSDGGATCKGNYAGCACLMPGASTPPPPPPPPAASPTPSLPPLQNPWYCLGIYTAFDCTDSGGCSTSWALGAENMDTGDVETTGLNGVGESVQNLCGATINGAEVVCQGDILTECSSYGVALYNSRTCRTYCAAKNDPVFCIDIDGEYFGYTLGPALICDRWW